MSAPSLSIHNMRKLTSFALVGLAVFIAMQFALVGLVRYAYWNESFTNAFLLAGSIWANYELNRRTTWRHVSVAGQAERFVTTRLATMAVSAMIFNVLLMSTAFPIWVNQAVGVLVGMAINFVVTDRWVFVLRGRKEFQMDDLDGLKVGWRTAAVSVLTVMVALASLHWGFNSLFVPLVIVLLSVVSLTAATLFLVSLLYPHRHESSSAELGLRAPTGRFVESFGILMPAKGEVSVFAQTILHTAITQRHHPDYRLFPIVCDGDPDTARVALAAAKVVNDWHLGRMGRVSRRQLRELLKRQIERFASNGSPLTPYELALVASWRRDNALAQVIIYPMNGAKSSKAKQINYALPQLWNDYSIFNILDAEDRTRKQLLTHVDQAFQDHPEVSIIQGAVQLMNPVFTGSRMKRFTQGSKQWFAWLNLLEYYRWFSGQMKFQSDNEVVPLGGNTVFLRAELLKESGGYIDSLAEDCATGIRATAVQGAKTFTFYDPQLATREQTPPNLTQLFWQRVRWNQGFLQTFLDGHWKALPTLRQRLLALWILTCPFFQAASALLLPVTLVTAVLVKSPVPLVLAMCLPVMALVIATFLQVKQLHEFGKAYAVKIPLHAYAIVVVLQLPYQIVLSVAALWAVPRNIMGNVDWHKTARPEDFVTVT